MASPAIAVELEALRALAERHGDEFDQIVAQLRKDEDREKPIMDRFGKTIAVGDKVTLKDGTSARVKRIDKKSRRVLVATDDDATHMVMAHRVEVRKGRPRRDSHATAAAV